MPRKVRACAECCLDISRLIGIKAMPRAPLECPVLIGSAPARKRFEQVPKAGAAWKRAEARRPGAFRALPAWKTTQKLPLQLRSGSALARPPILGDSCRIALHNCLRNSCRLADRAGYHRMRSLMI